MAHVQTPKEFLIDFTAHAKHAKKNIYLQSMIFENGKILTDLEPIFIQKAKEGLDVHIATDWIAHRYAGDDVAMLQPLIGETYRKMRDFQKRNKLTETNLIQAGAKITITNDFNPFSFIFPIFRRNHRKIYIVDDVAWIGGINFFDKGFETIDFMVKLTDPALVKVITEEFRKVSDQRPEPNAKITCTDNYEVLLDTGVIGKSIIYDEAVSLVKQAQTSVIFVSQFIPDGKLLDELYEKDIPVTIVTSHREHKYFTKFPYNIPYQRFLSKIKHKNNFILYHQDKNVHAKLIIVDGEKAIFGSHNFVTTGVLLGTKEIAIKTTDKQLVKDLEQYIEYNTKA